jgi:hypothetical protein
MFSVRKWAWARLFGWVITNKVAHDLAQLGKRECDVLHGAGPSYAGWTPYYVTIKTVLPISELVRGRGHASNMSDLAPVFVSAQVTSQLFRVELPRATTAKILLLVIGATPSGVKTAKCVAACEKWVAAFCTLPISSFDYKYLVRFRAKNKNRPWVLLSCDTRLEGFSIRKFVAGWFFLAGFLFRIW